MTEIAASEKASPETAGNTTQGVASFDDSRPDARLTSLAASIGATRTRGPAPVETWHPPYCGAIDMRIAADGTWYYAGTPISRRPLVELFAGILRKDPERYVLVTPVECVGIVVDDAPFVAVAMAAMDGRLHFITNVGDDVEAGADHPLRFETDADGGIKPYVHVRGGLWARLTRSLAIDLLDAAVTRNDGGPLGVRSGEAFFAIAMSQDGADQDGADQDGADQDGADQDDANQDDAHD